MSIALADSFGRRISYLRLSVTDRCDLRCVYCMAEDMEFLPKSHILSLEELGRVAEAFIRLGVRKLRLTGGEPLVRRGVMGLVERLGAQLRNGALDELTLTSNGTQLARHAQGLAAAGVRRINVSLDTLDPDVFQRVTRLGRLSQVLDGIAAAKAAGLAVKINTVLLKGVNDGDINALLRWCGAWGLDLTLIETMPLGEVEGGGRTEHYMPLDEMRRRLEQDWTLLACGHDSGGPARYVTVGETGRRLGFITPLSHCFCEGCNRVRVSCGGVLYPCLGQEQAYDLRPALRGSEADLGLEAALCAAIADKPRGHDFVIRQGRPAIGRFMSVTGG